MEPEPYDLAALQERVRGGWKPKLLFFWGHTPSSADKVDKACLSQWYPAPFSVDGVHYETGEHFMMAAKARLFGDDAAVRKILAAHHPKAVKEVGREVRDFDEALWQERRFEIVVAGSHAKFSQTPALARFLLGTKARVLVEASPTDKIWGIGLGADDPRAADPEAWRGLNLLGFALMVARARLAGGGPPGP